MAPGRPYLSADAQTAGLYDHIKREILDISAREDAVVGRESVIEEKSKRVQQLKADTDERLASIEGREGAIEQRESTLPAREGAIAAREATVAHREATLAATEERCRSAEEEAQSLHHEVVYLQDDLQEKTAQAERLEQGLYAATQEVAHWRGQTKTNVDRITYLEAEIHEYEEEAKRHEEKASKFEMESRGLQEQTELLQQRSAELKDKIASQDSQVKEIADCLSKLQSTSDQHVMENDILRTELDNAEGEHREEMADRNDVIKKLHSELSVSREKTQQSAARVDVLLSQNKKHLNKSQSLREQLCASEDQHKAMILKLELETSQQQEHITTQNRKIQELGGELSMREETESCVRKCKAELSAVKKQLHRAVVELEDEQTSQSYEVQEYSSRILKLEDRVQDLTAEAEEQETLKKNATLCAAENKALKDENKRLENELAATKDVLRNILLLPDAMANGRQPFMVKTGYKAIQVQLSRVLEEKQALDKELRQTLERNKMVSEELDQANNSALAWQTRYSTLESKMKSVNDSAQNGSSDAKENTAPSGQATPYSRAMA